MGRPSDSSITMRLSYLRYRLGQLLPTARRVYRQEGARAFVHQVWRWLQGERRRGRPAIETARRVTSQWGAWAEAQMSAAPIKAPPMRFLICIVGTYERERTQKSILAQTDASRLIRVQEDGPLVHARLSLNDSAEWTIFVRAGVVLNPTILTQIVETISHNPDVDVIYGDCLTLAPSHFWPDQVLLRPSLIGPLLLSHNVLEPMAVIRSQALKDVGGIDPRTGKAWMWDIAFKLMARGKPWIHVPRVLCSYPSNRIGMFSNGFTSESRSEALKAALERQGVRNAEIWLAETWPTPTQLLTWDLPHRHRVSVIIPSRDHASLIRFCLASVLNITEYDDLEVIVVDTGSTEPETQRVYEAFQEDARFRVIQHVETPFNFSRACNVGASRATGDLLLFLNNDIEVLITPPAESDEEGEPGVKANWLFEMAKWFALPQTGIVGARLYYPGRERHIQHMGVTVGFHGLAGHAINHRTASHQTPAMQFCDETASRQVLAVTGACLMISRRVFDEVGGWDEGYQLNFSDVQLCLDVHARGYQVIYAAEASLVHHEGQTHKRRVPRADFVRASEKFAEWLEKGDPAYHPAMSYEVPFGFNDDGHTPMDLNRRVMDNLPPDEWIQV